MSWLKRIGVLTLLLALAAALPVVAQEYRAAIYFKVVTEDGQPVAGAKVMLTGVNASRTATSNDSGEVRFTRVEPGFYTAEVEKDGFNIAVYTDIEINTGQNIEMDITMQRSEIVEKVIVTSRTPLLDRRDTSTGAIVSPKEVEALPTARDPWAILTTIPGIQTDRINVGGNQSGQQANFAGFGDDGFQATWVMDGVEFTDLAAQGGSATYFDWNSFQEIGFTTAGGRLEQLSPGQQLTFVTKQGANRTTGSIGLILADQEGQNDPPELVNPNGELYQGDRIDQTFEKTFDIGGPMVKDKAWFWFGFSQNNVNLLKPGETADTPIPDRTELQNWSAKLNGSFAGGNSNWKVFYTRGDKVKFGRNAGPSRPAATTWNQEGPSPIYTGEWSQFFGSNLELSFQASHVAGGFQLIPQGTADQVRWDNNLVWQDTFISYVTDRPTDAFNVRGNWFSEGGKVSNEVKFGFRYKKGEVQSMSQYGQQNITAVAWLSEAWTYREGSAKVDMEYLSLWAGDTMLLGNFTVNFGVLWMQQSGTQLASTSAGNALNTQLATLDYAGADPGFTWNNILPRVNATYTWGNNHRSLVRAGVNMYADQLGAGDVSYSSPAAAAELDYPWNDVNTDGLVDPGEVNFALGNEIFARNVWAPMPSDPVNFIDTNLEAPTVTEFLLGYEIEVMKDFTVAVNGALRNRDNTTWTPLIDLNASGVNTGDQQVSDPTFINSSDWLPGAANFAGTIACGDTQGPCRLGGDMDPFSITSYQLQDSAILGPNPKTNTSRPRVLMNRDGYDEDFTSVDIVATKRLSNKWMLRGYISYIDWKKNIDCNVNPQTGLCTAGPGVANPANLQTDTLRDGSKVAPGGSTRSGAFGDVFFGTSTWSANVNGLYQLPLGFAVSANLNAREGYVQPNYQRIQPAASDGILSRQDLQANDVDAYRYENIFLLDLKLSKLITFSGATTVDLGLELFNTFNDGEILQLESRVGVSSAGRIDETVSPRILRLGARVTF